MAKKEKHKCIGNQGVDVHTNSIERKIFFSLLNRKQFAEIQHLLTFLFLVPSCFILIILHLFIVAVRMCSHFRTVDNP